MKKESIRHACARQSLHADVYSGFSPNCQPGSTQDELQEVKKLQYVQTMDYHSAPKRNELLGHEDNGGMSNAHY